MPLLILLGFTGERNPVELTSPEKLCGIIDAMTPLLYRKAVEDVPSLAALAFRFLMELRMQQPAVMNPLIADAERIFEFNVANPIGTRRRGARVEPVGAEADSNVQKASRHDSEKLSDRPAHAQGGFSPDPLGLFGRRNRSDVRLQFVALPGSRIPETSGRLPAGVPEASRRECALIPAVSAR